jgi:hypothetical protein
VVDHSSRHPKVGVSSPTTVAGTRREKSSENVVVQEVNTAFVSLLGQFLFNKTHYAILADR